jgi:branched-chain amino acid transport system permease protein
MTPVIEVFAQQVFAGLASGAIYGLMALALVVIYQSTHHINFAQGEMATFSTFTAWALLEAGVPYWAAVALTIAGAFAVGAVIQATLLRPLAGSPVFSQIAVFIGLLLIFHALGGALFDHTLRVFPSPFPAGVGGSNAYLTAHGVGTLAVVLLVSLILFLAFRFTRLGLAMRAAALDPEAARLVGIRVDRMLALGWGLAASIGAIAGVLIAPVVFLDPNMMTSILLYGFAAALVGGIDNPWGALPGGIIVGVTENLLGAFVIGTEFKLSAALLLIVLMLLVRPQGLFGRRLVSRV